MICSGPCMPLAPVPPRPPPESCPSVGDAPPAPSLDSSRAQRISASSSTALSTRTTPLSSALRAESRPSSCVSSVCSPSTLSRISDERCSEARKEARSERLHAREHGRFGARQTLPLVCVCRGFERGCAVVARLVGLVREHVHLRERVVRLLRLALGHRHRRLQRLVRRDDAARLGAVLLGLQQPAQLVARHAHVDGGAQRLHLLGSLREGRAVGARRAQLLQLLGRRELRVAQPADLAGEAAHLRAVGRGLDRRLERLERRGGGARLDLQLELRDGRDEVDLMCATRQRRVGSEAGIRGRQGGAASVGARAKTKQESS